MRYSEGKPDKTYRCIPNADGVTKWCFECEQNLPLTNFASHFTSDRLYYRALCKKCHYKKYKDSSFESYYNLQYGITSNDIERMRIEQDNECANEYCENEKLCVDHDHVTGKVRGLLCNKCNSAIGFCDERAEVLYGLAEYLQKHQ